LLTSPPSRIELHLCSQSPKIVNARVIIITINIIAIIIIIIINNNNNITLAVSKYFFLD